MSAADFARYLKVAQLAEAAGFGDTAEVAVHGGVGQTQIRRLRSQTDKQDVNGPPPPGSDELSHAVGRTRRLHPECRSRVFSASS